MRWQRAVRVLMALIGIGCAVALYTYSRKRPPPTAAPPVLEDQKITSQRKNVGTIRTNVNTGKDDLTIEAEIETGYADGRTRLHRAHFLSKRSNGTVFEIWAGTADSEGKAVTGDEPGLIYLKGGVRTRASDGLEVLTDEATYDNIQGLATIPGKMTFTRGRLTGGGVGATYDRERDILWLLDEAHIKRAPDEKGEGALEATAKGIGVARPDRFMNIRENAKIVQPGQVLAADQLIVHFTEDDRGAKLIEMHGNAHLTPGTAAKKDAPDMQADEMLLEFHDDGQTLRHATLGGKSRMTQATDQGRQTITGPEIDIVMAADGRTLINLQAKGGVEVVLPASGENPDRDIRANSLVASGDEANGLKAAIFDGGVTFVEKTAGGGRVGRGAQGPPAVDRTGTSTSLVLDLKGQLGAILSSQFRQNVVFQDRDMKATAGNAVHNQVQGTLELTPGADARVPPRVDDGTVRVDAAWIQVDLTTHDVIAKTGVVTKMTQGRTGGRETRTAAIFDATQPVWGTGAQLKYVNASRAATFFGAPGVLTRIYQGDANNVIEAAEHIEVDQDTGNLLAVGQVRTSFLLEDSSEDAARGRSAAPKAAPKSMPAKNAPAGKAGAPLPAEAAPARTQPTVTTAAKMTFIDADRKAVYTGALAKPAEPARLADPANPANPAVPAKPAQPLILSTLKGPDADVTAFDITLTLARDQRALRTLEAVGTGGRMSATFEGGRETVGDQLTYDALTETHVIKGRPMYFKNVQNEAGNRKTCSLERSTELHYHGKDQSIIEPGSDTKALRPSEQVACATPLTTIVKK